MRVAVRRVHRPWTRVVASPFTPTDIAGLRLWLDASNAGSITSAGSPAKVSQWNDLSGNAYHLTQATGTAQPLTGSSTIGGLNALYFDGDDQLVTAVSPDTILGSASAGTALYVFKLDTDVGDGSAKAVLFRWGSSANNDHEPYSDGHVYSGWGSTVRKDTGDPTPAFTTARQVDILSASGAWTYSIDGVSQFTTGTNTVGWDSVARLVGLNLYGAAGEIVIYNTSLSGANLTNARNYLKAKWGTA